MFHPEPDILKDCDLLFFIERFQYTEETEQEIDLKRMVFGVVHKSIVIDIVEVKEKFRKQGVCRGILKYLRKQGVCRGILKYLRGQGVVVNVKCPTIEAYPFWEKMWKEGLIQNLPEKSWYRRI